MHGLYFFLLGAVLLLLGATIVLLGFGFTATSLLFRAFVLVLGLGSPSCRLLAFVLTRLRACLPSLFGLKETASPAC